MSAGTAGDGLPSPTTLKKPLSRRAFLRRAGMGAGVVTVVAGGGLAWRLADQSVLTPGTGVAYEGWHAELTGEGSLSLVRAAILAANAHDTQPWLFHITPDRVDLFADRTRAMGALDPAGRELDISLGCALENLMLAAPANGLAPKLRLMPDPAQRDHVARVDLRPAPTETWPLFDAIPQRHTDRSAYDATMVVELSNLDELSRVAESPAELVWLTTEPAKARFAHLTVEATEAIIADPAQAQADFDWYRQDWGEIQRRKDGITMDTAGLSEFMRLFIRILPSSDRATMQQGWVDATRDRHVATAAAFGLIAIEDAADTTQRIEAGRLLQRIHLASTLQGLALQPLNQVFERIDAEAATGGEPTFAEAMQQLGATDRQIVTAFRIGQATRLPSVSPRRPAEEVLVS